MPVKADMDWKDILAALDRQCAEHEISGAFRDAVRIKLIEKALIPIIRKAPCSLRVGTNPKSFSVRILWTDIPDIRIGILVYRPLSKPYPKPFIVFRHGDESTDATFEFDNEQEAAKALQRVLDKTV